MLTVKIKNMTKFRQLVGDKNWPQVFILYHHLNKLTRVIAVEIIANSETTLQTFSGHIANDFSASCVTHRLAWVACGLIAWISTIPIIIITGSKTFSVTLILLTLTPSPFLTLRHCHHWMHHSAIVKFHLCHWYITN